MTTRGRIRLALLAMVASMLVIGTARADDAAALASLTKLNRELAEVEQVHGQGAMGGRLHFVHGDIGWQPGRQFVGGRGWLALACDDGDCALRSAVLRVKTQSRQGHYDARPTKGQELRFVLEGSPSKATQVEVVAWFAPRQRVAFLKPGKVTTYATSDSGTGTFESTVRAPGGETRLVPLLWSAKEWPASSQVRLDRLTAPALLLQLRTSGQRQLLPGLLATCSGSLRGLAYLLWAGDLDGDEKPDYLVSYVDGSGPIHLYLSTLAGPGQLVGLAGRYNAPPHDGECEGNNRAGR